MDFPVDRFAYSSFAIRCFETSGNAYDACQSDEDLRNGHVLLIPSEQIVALAYTWPIAVTAQPGKLHSIDPKGFESLACIAEEFAMPVETVRNAAELARALGYPLDQAIAALLGGPRHDPADEDD